MSGNVFKEALEGLKGKRVLVTGATGFIGSRLVQVLVTEPSIQVLATVNSYKNAVKLARYPITFVTCDIASYEQVSSAVAQADVVVHCAYGRSGSFEEQARVTYEGCENVFRAAKQHGTERVVYMSTMSVYGIDHSGKLDENTPRTKGGFSYADAKIKCEEVALKYAHEDKVPISILQPTIVYGPFSAIWTASPLSDFPKVKMYLPNNGDGICNAVYIDDVVQAILLAAVKPEAVGELFLISGEEHPTWREFYHHYEEMLGTEGLDYAPLEQLKEMAEKAAKKPGAFSMVMTQLKKERTINFLRNFGVVRLMLKPVQALPAATKQKIRQKLLGGGQNGQATGAIAGAPRKMTRLGPYFIYRIHAAKPLASIEKAKQKLGYKPQTNLQQGMAMIEKWARWAGYLGK